MQAGARRMLLPFVVWRVGLGVLAAVAYLWIDPHDRPYDSRWLHDLGWGVDVWARWDSGWFTRIAEHGYASDVGTAAFFPLYPGLVGVLGRVLGGHFVLAAVVVSAAAAYAAFVLFYDLAGERLGEEGAERAVTYLAICPVALFLAAAYSEALYLALALAAFRLAERGRAWPAAGAAGLALLTRSAGVAVLAGLVVLAWPEWRRLAPLVLAPIVFLAFPLALRAQGVDALGFLHSQAAWDRHLSRAGPLGGLWQGIAALWRDPQDFTLHHAVAVDIVSLVFLALFGTLSVLAWRWFGAAYGVFCAVSLAIPLALPVEQLPLLSLPRLCLPLFPCFLALARVTATRPRVHSLVVASFSASLGVALLLWVDFRWVS